MFRKIVKSERGLGLIEALIAVAILGIISVAFLMGLFIATKSVLLSDNLATAESLARTQMEEIKNGPYANSYSEAIPQEFIDLGYSADVETDVIVAGLQKITVTILHDGNIILKLEGYKRLPT